MKISQKKNSHRVRYEFGQDEVSYLIQDRSGSRSFSVPYTGISRDRQTLTERNEWLRNAGLLWIVLGIVLSALSLSGEGGFRPSMWLFIGAACYAAYHVRATHFTLVPTDKGNLLVVTEYDGARILRELEQRRAAQLRREYDFFPNGDAPDQLRGRFNWLHREGALSDDELAQRLAMVEGRGPARISAALPPPGTLLN